MFSNLFERFIFWKKTDPDHTSDNLLEIARQIGPLVDEATNKIFMDYRETLIKEPITYIVPAVWGAIKDGKLTKIQKEINHRFDPVVRQILQLLVPDTATPAQRYATAYLIRGLMISKITFMIEGYKNRINFEAA